MVTIKLLTSRAGDGFTQPYGSLVEVDEDEAQRLLDAHQAELVAGDLKSAVTLGLEEPAARKAAKRKKTA